MVEDFIKRLELCCKEKGMARTKWAKEFGISEATIRNWIRRGNMPSAEIIYNSIPLLVYNNRKRVAFSSI